MVGYGRDVLYDLAQHHHTDMSSINTSARGSLLDCY